MSIPFNIDPTTGTLWREVRKDVHNLPPGERPIVTLTAEQIVDARSLRRSGMSVKEVAAQFGVSQTQVKLACRQRRQ
jgi:hypothetical protein